MSRSVLIHPSSRLFFRFGSVFYIGIAIALKAFCAASQTNNIHTFNNSTAAGTISGTGFRVYEFSVAAGESVSAYMAVTTNTMAFEPSISLVDPTGVILATTSGTNGALIPWMQITNSGKFSVICRDADGVGDGAYSVTVAFNPRTVGAIIKKGYEDPGEIGRSQLQSASSRRGQILGHDVDIYEFNAESGDRVLAFVGGVAANLGPVVTLHGPNGNELATASGPLSATLPYNSVDSAGTYYLACRDADAVGGSLYMLVLALNPAISGETNALIPSIARCGFLEIGRSDNYEFTANAGDAISISMGNYFGSSPFPAVPHPIVPSVSLYGPDNSTVITKSTVSGVWIPTLILTNSGTYRLLCGDSNNNGEGIYSVTVAKYPGSNEAELGEATTLVPGVERRGNVSGGDIDVYQFDAVEGDSVAVRFKSRASTFPATQTSYFVIQPGGDLLQSVVEPGVGDKLIPCLPHTGKHWFGVHILDGRGEMDYSIEWFLWPGPPSSEAPDHLQIVNCGTDAILRWRTNAAEFRLQGTSTLAQDPSLTIWADLPPPLYSARDGFYFFTNAIGSSFQAFRLIKP